MPKQQSIVIVGAGIAGILAAKIEMDKGNKVVLLDSSDQAGGLLKSDCVDGNYFDYGTHIIPETGIELLDEILFGDLSPLDYSIKKLIPTGNYFNGLLNEKSCYVDTTTLSSGSYTQGCYDILTADRDDESINLKGWYDKRYGHTFSEQIFCPVIEKYMGVPAKELSPAVGLFFDMSRLLAFDQVTTERLGVIEQYSSVLGHHIRKEGVKKYYPKYGGVGTFIEHMLAKLSGSNVEILLGVHIQKINQQNGLVKDVVTNKGNYKVDRVIWTIPIAVLANYVPLGTELPRPKFRSTSLFDFVFDKPLLSDVTYINVYDLNMKSARVTLYQNLKSQNDSKGSCTVEVLSDKPVTENYILKELVMMGLISSDSKCLFKRKRTVANGFPILDLQYVEQSGLQSESYRRYFENIDFLGKASEKAFFMKDVLEEVYNKTWN